MKRSLFSSRNACLCIPYLGIGLLFLLFSVRSSAQTTINWTGGVSTDYFTKTNWSNSSIDFANFTTTTVIINAGSPYNCVHTGGNSNTNFRPARLNVGRTGNFTVNGALYPNASDSLNGTVTVNAPADFNIRNFASIGNKANAVLTINGGALSSRNGMSIATGTGGSATVTVAGGALNAGTTTGSSPDLNLATTAGTTAQLNITGGGVIIARNLVIGSGGRIFISGLGILKIAGDKTTQLNSLVASGQLTCPAGKSLSIAFDGANTTASIAVNANSMLREYTDSVVINSGVIAVRILKKSGQVESYRYRGVELSGPGKLYTDWQSPYSQLVRCVYSVKKDEPGIVDISLKQTYQPGVDLTAMDHDLHFVVQKGDSALYTYIVRSHPASYPATHLDENRFVWKINQDFFEHICVDSARNWVMPNSYDYGQASATDIGEILKINTGARAGKYDCKYEFNKEYWNIGAYGHASDVNKMGAWAVFGGYDYFNDGPTKQDLTAASGIIHVHFGLDHYNGSNTVLNAGEEWSKITGPFLFYVNSNEGGVNALWDDAKARADLEKQRWPYSWLTNEPTYPAAAQRATVSGKFVVSDPSKPQITGGGAMVGLANPDPGVNWQDDSKRYQYWVKADDNGNFSIPHVRPGTYTLYAFVNGEIREFSKAGVTVSAGATSVGTLTWNIPRTDGKLLWEIGVADRTAKEYRHGDDYFVPYKFMEYSRDFSNPLEYTIGKNRYATDINYAHGGYLTADSTTWVAWPWHLNFNVTSLPDTGSVKLTLAFAGGESARMDIFINDNTNTKLFSRFYPSKSEGNILIREGIHGKYWDTALYIPVSKLHLGMNTINIIQGRGHVAGAHVMYDYISLEGNITVDTLFPALSLTAAKADVKCNGGSDGSITATFEGGIQPYQVKLGAGGTYATQASPFTLTGLAAGLDTLYVKDAAGVEKTVVVTVGQPTPISLNLGKTDVAIHGGSDGSITVAIDGGTAPYQVKLGANGTFTEQASGYSFTALAAGSDTIYVKDANGCEQSAFITINEPTELLLSAGHSDVQCHSGSDGSITLNFEGAVAPYEVKLGDGVYSAQSSPYTFNGLSAGSYGVFVKDAHGAEKTLTVTIEQPTAVVLSLQKSDVQCHGGSDGSVTVTFGGGTGSYQVKLGEGSYSSQSSPFTFSGLAGGSYTVFVKDANGCEHTQTITISEPAALTLSLSSQDVPCYGGSNGSLAAGISGGTAPYLISLDGKSFSAQNGFSGLVAGSYTVYVKDAHGCATTGGITIGQPTALSLGATAVDATSHGGSNGNIAITFSGGTAPYQVKLNAGSYVADAPSPYNFSGLTAGVYTVSLKDGNGCETTVTAVVGQPGSGYENKLTSTVTLTSDAITIYPNPSLQGQNFTVMVKNAGSFNYQLHNMNGTVLLNGKASGGVQIGSGLSSGYYFLKIQMQGQIYVIKLIKI